MKPSLPEREKARHEPPGWFWAAIILGSGLLMGVLRLLLPSN
jgi:hypothetical protein